MKTETEQLPPLIQYLIENTNDKSKNIYSRQHFKDRLISFRDQIQGAIDDYDQEMEKKATPIKKKVKNG